MKFRFSIRDLMWLTVVVALVVGWWANRMIDHQEASERCQKLQDQASAAHKDAEKLQAEVESLHARLTTMQQEKWVGELPVMLSGKPNVLLLRACAYAAWEAKVAYQRRAWFRIHPVKLEIDISDVPYFHKFSLGEPNLQISWIRLWLGDRLRQRVYVLPSTSTADKRIAAGLFPEADILEIPKGYP